MLPHALETFVFAEALLGRVLHEGQADRLKMARTSSKPDEISTTNNVIEK